MTILPIESSTLTTANQAFRVFSPNLPDGKSPRPGVTAAGLLLRAQASVLRDTLEIAPRRETRAALRQRLRAEIEAKRIIREARREEAAIRKRVREKLREEAAIEHSREGRIRMAYSAAELHQMLQTAMRLNIQI